MQAVSPAVLAPDNLHLAETVPQRRGGFRRVLLHLPPVVWAYCDVLIVAAATSVGYHLMVRGNSQYAWVAGPWLSGAAFCGGIALAGLICGLYERQTLGACSRILVRSLAALGVGLALAYACISLFFYGETTRWLGLCVASVYVTLAIPARIAVHYVVARERVNLLCLGSGQSIRKVADLVCRGTRSHHNIVGHLDLRRSRGNATTVGCERRASAACRAEIVDRDFERTCPRLGTLDDLPRVLRERLVDEIVVDSKLAGHAAVGAAVLTCLDSGCRVTDQATFVEKFLNEVPAETITIQWFLLADVQGSGGYNAVKRILDIVVTLFGLMLTLPLWPLIALLIRLDSRGPVIYRQDRVGLHGRVFNIYKFRTMDANAEPHGACWARENDARVTRVGRFLRKSRLDELPQLWNILRGDMSLVGPRPERPEFAERLAGLIPHYRQRHLIKPGLTGWAQIHYHYGASVEDAQRKLCYDLYYLKHRSIDFDTAIIIRTLGRFLLGAR